MSLFKSLFILLALFICVNALTTPHIARVHHHRAISARLAADPVDPLQPRRLSRRCKPRPSNSTTSVAHPSAAPANADGGSKPSPSSEKPSSTPAAQNPPPPPPSPATPTPPKAATPSSSPNVYVPPSAPKPNTPSPSPTPTPTPTPAHSSGSSSGNLPSFLVGTQTGQGTFYSTGLGACGITNTDADYIAAVSHLLFDAFPGYNGVNPNNNPVCNRKVQVNYQGKVVTVAITDRCTGCALTDLDFSPGAFKQLADFSVGRLSGVKWDWIS